MLQARISCLLSIPPEKMSLQLFEVSVLGQKACFFFHLLQKTRKTIPLGFFTMFFPCCLILELECLKFEIAYFQKLMIIIGLCQEVGCNLLSGIVFISALLMMRGNELLLCLGQLSCTIMSLVYSNSECPKAPLHRTL